MEVLPTGPFNIGATGATGAGVGIYAWARTSAGGALEYSNGFVSVVELTRLLSLYFSQPFVLPPILQLTQHLLSLVDKVLTPAILIF